MGCSPQAFLGMDLNYCPDLMVIDAYFCEIERIWFDCHMPFMNINEMDCIVRKIKINLRSYFHHSGKHSCVTDPLSLSYLIYRSDMNDILSLIPVNANLKDKLCAPTKL